MNRQDLKIIMHKFNSITNRLLQSNFDDYINVLKKYISFIQNTKILNDYIIECGGYNDDIKKEYQKVMGSNDLHLYFGDEEKDEVSNIFSLLKYISDDLKQLPWGFLYMYSRSGKSQEMLKAFNDRVVMVLIRYLQNYLTELGIKMGLDDNVTYNIDNKGQVNIANDSATINAVQNIGIDTNELSRLIVDMRNSLDENLTDEERKDSNDCIDVIESELSSSNPNEKNVKTQFKLLSILNKGLKFASTCCSLISFADKVYPFLSDIPNMFN